MTHVEKALEIYNEKFNCAQAVLGAFAPDYGLDLDSAMKVAFCLSGGMRKAEVCGAVSGALMVLGLHYGLTGEKAKDAKKVAYEKAKDFMERFEKENGSYLCRDLLGMDISDPCMMEEARSKNLFATLCPMMVASSVRILEDMLKE